MPNVARDRRLRDTDLSLHSRDNRKLLAARSGYWQLFDGLSPRMVGEIHRAPDRRSRVVRLIRNGSTPACWRMRKRIGWRKGRPRAAVPRRCCNGLPSLRIRPGVQAWRQKRGATASHRGAVLRTDIRGWI